MQRQSGKLGGAMGARKVLTEEERQAAVVKRVLETLGVEDLTVTERRALRAIVQANAAGVTCKATELAERAQLSLERFERACDGLLLKGFIGPPPLRSRASRRLH